MSPKKTNSGEAKKPKRSGHALNIWLQEPLFNRLETWRSTQRVPPTRTDVIEVALFEFLDREERKAAEDAKK